MALVAIEAAGRGLVTVTGIGVNGGDDPVPGDLAGDTKPPVVALLEVLAQHRGQQFSHLDDLDGQVPSVEHAETGEPIGGQLSDELFAGDRVVPVTRRLAARPVVVIAGQHGPQLGFEQRVGGSEELTDRRADHRDRVLGRYRVIQRCRVQHSLGRHNPGLPGRVNSDLEDALRAGRTTEPGPHIDQHRVRKPRIVEIQTAARVLPAGIKLERLDRFAVRQPEQALQHHHRRHDPRRHRPATRRGEQIGEQLIGKQHMAPPVQHSPNRVVGHPATNERRRALHQISLPRRQPQRHRPTTQENNMPVILP